MSVAQTGIAKTLGWALEPVELLRAVAAFKLHWPDSGIDDLVHQPKETDIMNFGYNGLIGLLVLAGDIWAILNIFQSSASNEKKLIWILAVVLLPVLGLLLWYFLGPRTGRSS